jgi:ABC-type glycerol-3-phosphate transport system permease component
MVETKSPDAIAPTTRAKVPGGPSGFARFGRWFLLSLPLIILVLWTLIPFLVTISVSFKTRGETFASYSLIPENPTLNAYREVLADPNFRAAFLNSVIVGFGTALLTIVLAVPAAYAFARFKFRGRHLLLLLVLLPRLVPSLGTMVPLYRLAAATGQLDKISTLIFVYTGTLLPLAVWLLVGFIQQIPRDIEEAAAVDGAALWARLRRVVLPLAAPATITIAALAFREAWNEFTLALVLTSSPGKRTLPFELFMLQTGQGIANFPAEAAFALLTVLPFLILYNRIERYMVAGLVAGSSK